MTKSDLPANFLIYLNNGTLDIKCDDEPSINFSSKGNIRTIDIFDIPLKMSKKPGLIKQLSEAKHMARKLKEEKEENEGENVKLEEQMRNTKRHHSTYQQPLNNSQLRLHRYSTGYQDLLWEEGFLADFQLLFSFE